MQKSLIIIFFLFISFVCPAQGEETIETEKKNGLVVEYYPNGTLKTEALYIDGKKEGVYKEFYPNGFLEKIVTYQQDVQHGDLKKYNENGRLILEWKFVDGEMIRNYVRQYDYYEKGNLKLEYFYDNGEGFRNEYYASGQISSRLVIKFGKEFKVLKYNEEGHLISEKFLLPSKHK